MGLVTELISELSVGGINVSDTSEGGPICWNHVPLITRLYETSFGILLGLCFLVYGSLWHSSPSLRPIKSSSHSFSLKCMTLALYTIFIVEIGYKVASRQVIFLWMPCHLITICQLYILTSLCLGMPTLRHEYVTRIMFHFLHGPLTALLFPVTDCLRLPYEAEVYWIQHLFILCVVPPYLMKNHFDLSSPGEFSWSWSFLSYGIWMLMHWILLQGVSLLSGANVGAMLCPATSDPFAGKHYRLYGIVHQLLSILLMGQIWATVKAYLIHPTQSKNNS